jgi:hypothetical protein
VSNPPSSSWLTQISDGQFDPSIIKQFAEEIKNCDLVLGFLPNRKRTFSGRILSAGEKALYRILFGKLPKFQGVLMLRTSMMKQIELVSSGRGWAVIIEFIIRANRQGFRIKSVSTDLRNRVSGRSKVTNLNTVVSNLIQIAELRIKI